MTTDAASRLTRRVQGFDLLVRRKEGIELEVANDRTGDRLHLEP